MVEALNRSQTRAALDFAPICRVVGFYYLLIFLLAKAPQVASSSAAWFHQCPDGTRALSPVVIKGKKFFVQENGEYFPIRGVAYYPRPNAGPLSVSNSVDFFTDQYQDLWMADLENFKALGINSVRIYGVDPSQNHDAFMCALQDAGIYVLIGLQADCEKCNIGRDGGSTCYPPELKIRGHFIINTFSKYNNTLAFSAGNEVGLWARDQVTALNAPCQKKFLRDMRAYVNTCSGVTNSILPRKVPIGVVTADRDRQLNAMYYNCQTSGPQDELEHAEWYGLNAYQHCDASAQTVGDLLGYQQLQQDFNTYNLPVPVFFAEMGCMNRWFPSIDGYEGQRNWLQMDAIYGESEYVEEFAGAMVFEYSTEKKKADESWQATPFPYRQFASLNFGIGYYLPEDCNHLDVPCSEYVKYPEFDLLVNKLKEIADAGNNVPNMNNYTENAVFPECPAEIAPISEFLWPSDETEDMPCDVIETKEPTSEPSVSPTGTPSMGPSWAPSMLPSSRPSEGPTLSPSSAPTKPPSSAPTRFIMVAEEAPSQAHDSSVPTNNGATEPPASPSMFVSSSIGSSATESSSSDTTSTKTWTLITMLMPMILLWD